MTFMVGISKDEKEQLQQRCLVKKRYRCGGLGPSVPATGEHSVRERVEAGPPDRNRAGDRGRAPVPLNSSASLPPFPCGHLLEILIFFQLLRCSLGQKYQQYICKCALGSPLLAPALGSSRDTCSSGQACVYSTGS